MDNATFRSRSGSETRQRNAPMARMRLTRGERAILDERANDAGLTVGAFMRQQCLSAVGPRAVRRPPVERAALAQLLAQLGKCGSNLNQIARVLNSGGEEPPGIADAITEFRNVCAHITRTLGRDDR